MAVKPVSFGPFQKLLDSSTGVLTQPKGSVPRLSNLLASKRGSLRTCDGTTIVDAYNGVPASGRGRAMAEFFFEPTGVTGYWLRIMQALDQPLSNPTGLSVTTNGSGHLTIAQPYYWVITAIDGSGGETIASNEVTFTPTTGNQSVTLAWNPVPGAAGYNVYRGTSPGGEVIQIAFTGSGGFTETPLPTQATTWKDFGNSTSGTATPPLTNDTTQTALYMMPTSGISYTDANIVAFFPAQGNTSSPAWTPSGGIAGAVSYIPQMVQFTNQVVIALGNGVAPQVFSDDTGTPTNPAFTATISAISVDANGVVTITASGSTGLAPGANIQISGVTNPAYNTNGHGSNAFIVTNNSPIQVVNQSAIGQAPSSGGTMTVTTYPVYSTFTPAYPVWTASVNYAENSIIEPTVSNGFYYKAVQGGTSGGSQPTFPTVVGQQVADGQIIWVNAGLLNSAAPAPVGCGHVTVYAGSVWMFNTWVSNTATGLDGPTSLRMSDVNNLNSWNPINQAFLDKDDGTEGLGLGTFTIAAQGIPPEGSLCAFKRRAVYQIVGVFGADNFAIQRTQSDMGILAPRTLQFVPGFGLMRSTYIGFAVFDGVNDRIVSVQVGPYLIGSNDPDNADIAPMDPQWQTIAQSALTANPPMYCTAIPIAPTGAPGASGGQLTRMMCFDLVLKAWAVVDLPFPISTMFGVVTFSTVAQTALGSFNDGTLQQWAAAATTWATSVSGSPTPGQIAWSLRSPTNASKDASERLYLRRIVVIGQQTSAAPSTLNIQSRNGGMVFANQNIPLPSSGDVQAQSAGGQTGRRFDALISGSGMITIDSIEYHLEPRPVGVMAGSIA